MARNWPGRSGTPCDNCDGDGVNYIEEDGSPTIGVECPKCDGTGYAPCATCDGTGYVGQKGHYTRGQVPCPTCDPQVSP